MASTSTSSDGAPLILRIEFGKPGGALWPGDRRSADLLGYGALDTTLGLTGAHRESLADLAQRHAMLRKGRPTAQTLATFRADAEALRASLAAHLGPRYTVLTGVI